MARTGKGWARSILLLAYHAVERVYGYAFARPSMQKFNNRLLHLALHARGYGDTDPSSNGEHAFLGILIQHKPKLCIDVGANVGNYSESLLLATDSTVLAFEPLPASFAQLQKLSERFPGRLYAVNKGVGKESGQLNLHYGNSNTEIASFAPEVKQVDYVGANNSHTIPVPVTTIDEYLRENPQFADSPVDFIKIDTEGFECEVLLGAQQTLARARPKFVQIEFNWHHMFKGNTIFSLASHLPGYVAFQITSHGAILSRRDVKSPLSNFFMYSNFVFVREDLASFLGSHGQSN